MEEGRGGVYGEDGRPATARLGTGILGGRTRVGCDPTVDQRTVPYCAGSSFLFSLLFSFPFPSSCSYSYSN